MITIKTPEEIKIMAEGGKILAKIIKELEKKVKPGITTKELDRVAETLIFKSGGTPSFKGYEGFPASLCTSINEELVHAVPSQRKLKEGDILSLDLGMKYQDYHSDMAITLPVGKISPEAQRLIRVTKKTLKRGIKKARPGNTFGDIGNTIQRYVEDQGFNVVRDLCGHGIGRELHEEPKILNYGKRHSGPEIKEGMVFCLEPMVTVGDWKLKKSKDGYGYETADSSLSCHFEHMMVVTKNGAKILTTI
ncbi:MAG: type I methionyl aminopeptidase [Candidatus Nealsonbacteria bacterium]|nr:MAG: type I methionyl aminopeptidase [Candidatus Nealsonbacteria bacterium]